MKRNKIHVVLNPKSAGGKTAKMIPEIKSILDETVGKDYSLCVVEQENDAMISTYNALKNGCELVVAAGGDGTIQNTINGFFDGDSWLNSNCKLGLIDSGTGSGFAQSIGLPDNLRQQINKIKEGNTLKVDIGKIHYKNGGGSKSYRYFINECQIGIGGKLVKDLKVKYKKMGGFLAFGVGTFGLSLVYDAHPMSTMTKDDVINTKNLGISVMNGSFTGGGMNLAPDANISDGKLDILIIKEQPVTGRIMNLFRIYSGKHIKSDKFKYFQSSSIEITSDDNVYVGADGEYLGCRPCSISIIPSAIKVCI